MTQRMFGIAASVVIMAAAMSPIHAEDKDNKKGFEIPHCVRSLGTAAVRIAPDAKDWWSGENLASPDTVVKGIVQQSGCFLLVDRGAAMALADEERGRAAAGNLRAGSNIGRGQVRAADYIIVPTLLSQNAHAGGTGIGGLIGFVPGFATIGALAGGVNLNKKTANVHLEIVDVRSSEVVASADGFAKKKDLGWGGAGGGFGSGGFAAVGATGYTDTEIGQVVMAAYIDAYIKLIAARGGITPALPATAGSTSPTAAPAQPEQASVITIRGATLRASPLASSRALQTMPTGTMLFPTGQKSGVWVEVADEAGTRGWVSSLSISSR